uniref:Septin-type G domain-containing protein n=1 Tax=Sus scrofa TaxID=9823 RepID=A0A8D0TG83_PIG
ATAVTKRAVGSGCREMVPHADHVSSQASLEEQEVFGSLEKSDFLSLRILGEQGLGNRTIVNTLPRHRFRGREGSHEQEGHPQSLFAWNSKSNPMGLKLTNTINHGHFSPERSKPDHYAQAVAFLDQRFQSWCMGRMIKIRKGLHLYHENTVFFCLFRAAPKGEEGRGKTLLQIDQNDPLLNLITCKATSSALSQSKMTDQRLRFLPRLSSEIILPYGEGKYDKDTSKTQGTLSDHFCFTCTANSQQHQILNPLSKARDQTWGYTEVSATSHCSFLLLDTAEVLKHMENYKKKTHTLEYSAARIHRLEE